VTSAPLKLAIVGAGAVGCAHAALAASRGHDVTLISPSGGSLPPAGPFTLKASGALAGEFAVRAASVESLKYAELVLVSLPAYGYGAVLRSIAQHVASGATVLFLPALSLVELALQNTLAESGKNVRIASSGTTVATARKTALTEVRLLSVRSRVDIAALPVARTPAALEAATALFGDRFTPQTNVLAIALGNLNPISHVPLALANLSRIESGEAWTQYDRMTGATAQMIEAVDAERLALAQAFGIRVRSIHEHFHHSFGVALDSLDAQSRAVHATLGSPAGPTTLSTRYFTEDVPYGLAVLLRLAKLAGVNMPVMQSVVTLASAAFKRNFETENALPMLGGCA
jgi:opine dehydrogenase